MFLTIVKKMIKKLLSQETFLIQLVSQSMCMCVSLLFSVSFKTSDISDLQNSSDISNLQTSTQIRKCKYILNSNLKFPYTELIWDRIITLCDYSILASTQLQHWFLKVCHLQSSIKFLSNPELLVQYLRVLLQYLLYSFYSSCILVIIWLVTFRLEGHNHKWLTM